MPAIPDRVADLTDGQPVLDHVASTSNPHGVTKAQVGLGNVANVDQTNADNLATGKVDPNRLGDGTPGPNTFLTGDQGWQAFGSAVAYAADQLPISDDTADALNLKLAKASNLSDLASASTALVNIGGNNATNLTTGTLPVARIADGSITVAKTTGFGTAALVADNTLVHLAGTETITGAKTFSSNISFGANGAYDIGSSGARVRAIHLNDQLIGGSACEILWTNRSIITSPADGKVLLRNSSRSDFTALLYGGTTNLFPATYRNGSTLEIKLADNSAYAPIKASNGEYTGTLTVSGLLTASAGTRTPSIGAVSGAMDLASDVFADDHDILGVATLSAAAIEPTGSSIAIGDLDGGSTAVIGGMHTVESIYANVLYMQADELTALFHFKPPLIDPMTTPGTTAGEWAICDYSVGDLVNGRWMTWDGTSWINPYV